MSLGDYRLVLGVGGANEFRGGRAHPFSRSESSGKPLHCSLGMLRRQHWVL